MTFKLVLTRSALEMLKKVEDRRIRKQIWDAISDLSLNPEIKGKALLGELAGYRSLRAAGQRYRVIYQVVANEVLVVVVAVGKRKEGDRKDVYSLARKLFRQRLVD